MAVRKVSHHSRIKNKTSTSVGGVTPGKIIEFKYRNPENDNYDKTPMIWVLSKKGKIVSGLNMNYLKEYKIQLLIDDYGRMIGERVGDLNPELKKWPLFEKAFRTYSMKHMKMIKIIEWETDEMRREKNKGARAKGADDEVKL